MCPHSYRDCAENLVHLCFKKIKEHTLISVTAIFSMPELAVFDKQNFLKIGFGMIQVILMSGAIFISYWEVFEINSKIDLFFQKFTLMKGRRAFVIPT